jgi:hypothetical protein
MLLRNIRTVQFIKQEKKLIKRNMSKDEIKVRR